MALHEWTDGDVLYADDLNGYFEFNLTNMLINQLNIAKDGIDTYSGYQFIGVWDMDSQYDSVNSSNVIAGDDDVVLDIDTTATATTDYDFSGGSRDPDFTTAVSTGGSSSNSVTFDAANDEEDLSVSAGDQSSAYARLILNTSLTEGQVWVDFRNVVHGVAGNGIRLVWGNDYVDKQRNAGAGYAYTDSESGSYSPTDESYVTGFRITRVKNSIKTEYYDSNLASWVTISEGTNNVAPDAATPYLETYATQSTRTITASAYNVFAYRDKTCLFSSGVYVVDAATPSASSDLLFLHDEVTLNSGTITSIEFSMDDGGNYTSITEHELTKTANAGTALKLRWTIASSGTDSPQITTYAGYYD